jgi:hypothetical protein
VCGSGYWSARAIWPQNAAVFSFEIVNCVNTFENCNGKSFIPLKKYSFFGEGTICSHGKKIEPVACVRRICSRCRMPQPLSTLVSWWWSAHVETFILWMQLPVREGKEKPKDKKLGHGLVSHLTWALQSGNLIWAGFTSYMHISPVSVLLYRFCITWLLPHLRTGLSDENCHICGLNLAGWQCIWFLP